MTTLNKLIIRLLLMNFMCVMIIACNYQPKEIKSHTIANHKIESEKNSTSNYEKATDIVESPEYLMGKTYYTQYCMACHMQDGLGVSSMNPPLSKTSWVLGDKKRLIDVVLNGMSGEIEINDEIYSNSMGSFAMLKDKEIALILSYVRQSFGNDASAITEEEVKSVRATQQK